ncbi:CMRF35-like molecule 8 isoform X1 [Salmo trutta]|uniref:CMRF35-like molecule 8 isoform X1 n=1 Tax=Salmo trutta TaxID=8032 RepID=UPI001131F1BB|nr:CMRF35-like molecule 8 isoform X1 [Salmo trutta]
MVILLVLTLKIVLLLAAVWSVYTVELITVEGYKGGKAEIRCPYREEWRSHQKYLCKGSKMECITFLGDNDIETEDEEWTSKWRYSLHDDKGVRVFIVTITNMVSDGAGKYWCGVERFGLDPEVYGDWCCENPTAVTGYEEQTVSIYCMYDEKTEDNEKYFCKVTTQSRCIDDVKVTTTKSQNGRFSLFDNRTAGAFTVTITRLTQEDAGRYLCGVQNNQALDTLSAVQLDIKISPTLSSPPTATSQPTANSISPSSILPSTHNRSDTSVVIIVSGTLVMLLLVLVVSLLIVYRGKFNKETADSSAPKVNTDTRINREGCHGDGEYEEIKDRPRQSSSGGETTTVYATANLPTRPFDSLNYANVNFHKNPSCPNEATVAIAKEGTSPGDYATVNIGQSPAYSTVNHPHSTSEAPPIYYIVSKPRDP